MSIALGMRLLLDQSIEATTTKYRAQGCTRLVTIYGNTYCINLPSCSVITLSLGSPSACITSLIDPQVLSP